MRKESLLLKWGTVKGWNNIRPENQPLLEEYMSDAPLSCAADHPDEARKALLCKLIDKINGEIWNDWDGVILTKDAAKNYILNYGTVK